MIGPESDKNPLHSAARFSPDFKKNAHKMNFLLNISRKKSTKQKKSVSERRNLNLCCETPAPWNRVALDESHHRLRGNDEELPDV